MPKTLAATPRAVLVGVQLPDVSDVDHEASLAELGRLVHTLGFEVVGTVSQKRRGLASGTVVGHGKLQELARFTGGTGEVPSSAPDRKSKARDKWEEEAEEAVEEDEEEELPVDESGEPLGASVVVVDHELSPSQARNLERATGASGARSHRRHRGHLPSPREEPRSAHAGGDRPPQLRRPAHARDCGWHRAAAGPGRG